MTKRADITGKRFGRLSAVELSEETNSRSERFWLCLCDCGNHKHAMYSDLKSGKTQSCGCKKTEVTVARNIETKTIPVKQRFQDGYEVSETGCWEWKKGKDANGYGIIHVSGRLMKAHRLSWQLHKGEIPDHDSYHGMMVCHHCDNPGCVNPEHLFLGEAKDNVLDMVAKGRNRFGIGDRHGSKTHPEKYKGRVSKNGNLTRVNQ